MQAYVSRQPIYFRRQSAANSIQIRHVFALALIRERNLQIY